MLACFPLLVRLTFWDFGGNSAYADVRKELYHQTKACLSYFYQPSK